MGGFNLLSLMSDKYQNPSEAAIQISIFNNLGQNVWGNNWKEGTSFFTEQLDVEELGNEEGGVYYISVQIGEEIYHEKVLVHCKLNSFKFC